MIVDGPSWPLAGTTSKAMIWRVSGPNPAGVGVVAVGEPGKWSLSGFGSAVGNGAGASL